MARKSKEEEAVAEFTAMLTADPKKPFDKKAVDAFMQAAWPTVERAFYCLPPDRMLQYFTKFMEWKLPRLASITFEDTTKPDATMDKLRQLYGKAYVDVTPTNTIEA